MPKQMEEANAEGKRIMSSSMDKRAKQVGPSQEGQPQEGEVRGRGLKDIGENTSISRARSSGIWLARRNLYDKYPSGRRK